MKLSCVKVECSDCNAEDYLSAGAFVRLTGKALQYNTAAIIPKVIGCRKCSSNEVLISSTNGAQKIVTNFDWPLCKICHNNIPELFFISFPHADFCPSCVAEGKISDSDILNATGELFLGEAYYCLSLQFRDDHGTQVFWLRKAVNQGHLYACYTLGDFLVKSSKNSELQEAANSYKLASTSSEDFGRSATYKYANMMLKGKGLEKNRLKAIEILEGLAEKEHIPSCRSLGNFYLLGENGIKVDEAKAYKFYYKEYELHPKSMSASATLAFLILNGIGIEANLQKGSDILKEALSIYGENKPKFDQLICMEEILSLFESNDVELNELKNARIYLDWMKYINVPIIEDLLRRCGGSIPNKKPKWEFSLLSVIPRGVKGHRIRDVRIPSDKDRLSQMKTLGQVEELTNKSWIVTTDDSEIIGDTYISEGEAVRALTNFKKCDAKYIDFQTMMKRFTKTKN